MSMCFFSRLLWQLLLRHILVEKLNNSKEKNKHTEICVLAEIGTNLVLSYVDERGVTPVFSNNRR